MRRRGRRSRPWRSPGNRAPPRTRFGRPVDPRTGTPMIRAIPPGTTERAIATFVDIAEGRWESATRDFNDRMRAEVTAERIAAVYAQVIGMVGVFERIGEPVAFPAGDFTTVEI